jgi:hypothetical protein
MMMMVVVEVLLLMMMMMMMVVVVVVAAVVMAVVIVEEVAMIMLMIALHTASVAQWKGGCKCIARRAAVQFTVVRMQQRHLCCGARRAEP